MALVDWHGRSPDDVDPNTPLPSPTFVSAGGRSTKPVSAVNRDGFRPAFVLRALPVHGRCGIDAQGRKANKSTAHMIIGVAGVAAHLRWCMQRTVLFVDGHWRVV